MPHKHKYKPETWEKMKPKRTGVVKQGAYTDTPRELTVNGSYAAVGGRPSKYTDEQLCQAVKDYLERFKDNDEVPYHEELIDILGVYPDTYFSYKKHYPQFQRISKRIDNLQKLRLLRGGVKNKLNVVGTIFQLKVNHGMIETEKRLQQSESKLVIEWRGESQDSDNNRLESSKKATSLPESVPEDAEIVD